MQALPPYTLTNESITIFINGKSVVVRKGMPNFQPLRNAIMSEDWAVVQDHLNPASSLQKWVNGLFTLEGETFKYNGQEIPRELNSRIVEMATNGEDPTSIMKFWERLQKNPSYRSVQQLWSFLEKKGIPITPNGMFLAYKSVRGDYKDHHSGKHDNSPGAVNEMLRNQISDDPEVACDVGFHVGSLEYARTFSSDPGAIMVICEIDPENVVSVPKDHNAQKMRVCKYIVKGHHNSVHMPSTSFDPNEEMKSDVGGRLSDDQVKELVLGVDYKLDEGEESDDGVEEKRVGGKGWKKFDNMGIEDLMNQSIEDLRRYAAIGLKIVGASKIPGGKIPLIQKILEIRA